MSARMISATLCAMICTCIAVGSADIVMCHDALADPAGASNHFGDPVWEPASVHVTKIITTSIVGQLKAFKEDDYARAAYYQSVELKQSYGSVDTFRTLIKSEYPEFADYKSVQFGPISISSDSRQVQAPVVLTGADGIKVAAVYLMVAEKGSYLIAGVVGGERRVQSVQIDPAVT